RLPLERGTRALKSNFFMAAPVSLHWARGPACPASGWRCVPHGGALSRCSAPGPDGPIRPEPSPADPSPLPADSAAHGSSARCRAPPAQLPGSGPRPPAANRCSPADRSAGQSIFRLGLSSAFLRHAQYGAAGTGIGRHFLGGRLDRLAAQIQAHLDVGVAYRQIARQRRAPGLATHELLDLTVFEGMEADDRQSATRRKHFQRRLQALGQVFQLTVDEDADPLERPGGRMLVFLPGGVGLLDHFGQIGGGGERLLLTAQHDGAGHAAGEALFAILPEHGGDVRLVGAVDPVGSALTHGGVHAHVQRTIVEKAEAALGVVQLRRGDAKVQQHAVHPAVQAARAQLLRHVGERALYNDKAAVFGRQLIPDPDRLRVLVEAEQSPLRRQLGQNGAAMPAAAKGTVYIYAVRSYREPFQRFAQQYTDMFQFGLLI